jgi:ArsR family transcriptional regulator, virulence genes transcriptional regulator
MNVETLTEKSAQAAKFLKALASRHRLTILCQLIKGEAQVGELQKAIGLSQSSLSQHLAILRADGIVKTRRESQAIHYSLADENVTRMMQLLEEMFCAHGQKRKANASRPPRQNTAKASCSFKSGSPRERLR